MSLHTSIEFAAEEAAASTDTDVHRKWFPLLDILAVDSDTTDDPPISLMIVAHVTYRSSLLLRTIRAWRRRLKAAGERQRWQACLADEWYARRRLFLFFRAWQWRYSEKWHERANIQAANTHCTAFALRRAMHAWRNWLQRKRELRNRVMTLCEGITRAALSRYWAVWHRQAVCSAAYQQLRVASDRRVLQWWWRVWRRGALRSKAHQLHLAVLVVHTPSTWVVANTVLGGNSALLQLPRSCGSTAMASLQVLATRFYWIHWLGVVAHRRGLRLQRYRAALRHIEINSRRRTMVCSYHTWLMRTASTLHCRRTALVTCREYFCKWLVFCDRQLACRRRWKDALERWKVSLLRKWWERTEWRLQRRQRVTMADAFCDRTLRSRQRAALLEKWRERVHSRLAYRALMAETRERRTELLRDVAVNRLLNGVLLSFWQPSGGESSVGEQQRRIQTQEEVSDLCMPCAARETDAAAVSRPPPTTAASNTTTIIVPSLPTSGDAVAPGDPVTCIRRRLVTRSPAIPLGGRAAHTAVATALAPRCHNTAESSVSPLHHSDVVSPPSPLCRSPVGAAPLLFSMPVPSPSLSTSMSTLRFDSRLAVAESRELLGAYRAMLATASAESEEARILREKLHLYEEQKRSIGGSSSSIAQSEQQLQQRLLALRQRELDRQALRFQVVQLAKHLEVVLNGAALSRSSSSS
ncbi:putative leucine-rich repeat protein (LRRP), partial [Trypanosoma grayi]|uniref:putative leucine-rich repeat protein (LRRP) n=1 Tax=Trypanosoma grayi TaxID=71804 RepID=UPI0004F49BA8